MSIEHNIVKMGDDRAYVEGEYMGCKFAGHARRNEFDHYGIVVELDAPTVMLDLERTEIQITADHVRAGLISIHRGPDMLCVQLENMHRLISAAITTNMEASFPGVLAAAEQRRAEIEAAITAHGFTARVWTGGFGPQGF